MTEQCAQANKLLGFVRRASRFIQSTQTRLTLYLSIVRCHLGYATQVWASQSIGLLKACLHEGGGPQVGEVKCGGSPHLIWKRNHIKMRDYMDRRVTPPKRVTSPTRDPPPPCKQTLKRVENVQRSVTKLIFKLPFRCEVTYKTRLQLTNLLLISFWHEIFDIVFFYKAVNNLVFIDSEALSSTRQSTRSTRSSSSNAFTYQRSFFIRACRT